MPLVRSVSLLLFVPVLLTGLMACAADLPLADVPTDTGLPPIVLDRGWYGITGAIALEDGQITAAEITLELWEEDVRGRPAFACDERFDFERVDGVPPPLDEDVTLFASWPLTLPAVSCIGAPDRLQLAIGPMLPLLWPALDQAGVSQRTSRGLYLLEPSRDELLIFGYAGTTEQLAGRGVPASLEPLPDGEYQVRTTHLVPIAEADPPRR